MSRVVSTSVTALWVGKSCVYLAQGKHEMLLQISQQSSTEQLIKYLSATKGMASRPFFFSSLSPFPQISLSVLQHTLHSPVCTACQIHQAVILWMTSYEYTGTVEEYSYPLCIHCFRGNTYLIFLRKAYSNMKALSKNGWRKILIFCVYIH